MQYCYRAYGCNLVSDIAFEQLLTGTDAAFETITIEQCDSFADPPKGARRIGPSVIAAPNYISLDIDGVLRFVAENGTTLRYRPYENLDPLSLQVFLMGSGLGSLLMQRNFLVLHGNGVEVDGNCIICVGPSGVGKSTTAAGLMRRGYRVMSDDVCAIDDHGRLVPGVPHIKLWQEAANGLSVDTVGLSRVRPEMEKFRVPMEDAFCADNTPVKRIYVLAPHETDTVTCEALTGLDIFTALQTNTYRLPFIDGLGLSVDHFQKIAALSQRVVVKTVRRPMAGFKLDELLDVLIADATGD
ncbi:hypothetical protein L0664_14860 [Octadecabacter sp. G9-8]|uniref:HPr kinase/phosphorylase C-terminal domain-containing protein n=1 Tax=Octadecabacter dasysiphoniae TaxID=2909341 RepID=A0ABS9CYW6_9RHOB|nr:hypothetical protein [Octadecabacter dasysiphoniae]MCF2872353.1 hypothetical protein [Octadecabacter dasysiphoniae]